MPSGSLGRLSHGGGRLLPSQRQPQTRQVGQGRGRMPSGRRVAPEPTRAARQTVETPTAPGSNSNFTGLPKNGRDIPVTTPVTDPQMQEYIDLVRDDFKLVFKDIMDREHFEDKVYFRDPITTNLNSFRVYQAIVQSLRYFLAPIYELHEIRQAGEQEILVKWSWTMNFWWNRYDPLKPLWDPRLVFTGLTVLGYNRATGKWNKHVDAWDAVQNNEFFSPEAWIFAFGQMFQVSKPPNRFTPEFQVYKKYKGWEIRRYRPHLTVEVSLAELESSDEAVGAGPGIDEQRRRAQRDKAEVLLERYLALGNEREEFFELTTPLFVGKDDVFSLCVPGYKNLEDLPQPHKEGLVKLKQQPERFYASVSFSGHPSREDLQEKERFLRAEIEGDNSRADGDGWLFARYNKEVFPYGPFRRNDLLIPLEADSVDLWGGVDWAFVDRVVAHKV